MIKRLFVITILALSCQKNSDKKTESNSKPIPSQDGSNSNPKAPEKAESVSTLEIANARGTKVSDFLFEKSGCLIYEKKKIDNDVPFFVLCEDRIVEVELIENFKDDDCDAFKFNDKINVYYFLYCPVI